MTAMQTVLDGDYFTDLHILREPYEYFERLRASGPVVRLRDRDVVVVTGFEESLEVLKNTDDFSSAIAPQGPAMELPFSVADGDVAEQIETHRGSLIGGDLLVAYDGKQHAASRSILSKLFTPSRLKANEDFMWEYADKMVRDAVARGESEVMGEIATRYVTIVIADLLGVPEDDRELFMEVIANGPPAGAVQPDGQAQMSSLEFMGRYFAGYVMDRRKSPREDVLTDLATATYPDGTLPDLMEIVRLATFLFAAGQDTSAKLLGNALRYIVDMPGLQARLRDDQSLIPAFIEEVLRLEGSTKMTARIAKRDTKIAGFDIPAGQRVMIALAAANRDPIRWPNPAELEIGRSRIKEHLAFGRGAHVCAGAPLARVEVRVLLERLFAHTSNIAISEAKHGEKGARTFAFEPTFIIRGLTELHIELSPR